MSETFTPAAEPATGPTLEAIVATEVAKDVAADLRAEPAPAVASPNVALRAALTEARGKAATAKRQLMLDNLADAVCDALDAIIAASA